MQSAGGTEAVGVEENKNLEETMDLEDAKKGLQFSMSKKDQAEMGDLKQNNDKILIDLTKFNNKNVNLDIKLKENYPKRPSNAFTGNSSDKKSIVF